MPSPRRSRYYLNYFIAMLLTGVIAGLVGLLLSLLLHLVQHLAFGYNLQQLFSSENFLEAVRSSAPWRRVVALVVCGLVVGIGWWALYRYAAKLVSINQALKAKPPAMPIIATWTNAILQIVSVGLGSPLGRELAPREASASITGWLAQKLGLTIPDAQVMLACGAGAGLAAVYNIPLAGALFTLEVLLVTFRWTCVVPALFTSTLAAVIAWSGLGNEHQYHIGEIMLSYSLVIWAVLVGPIIGCAAFFFVKTTQAAQAKAPKDYRLIPLALLNFLLIGLLAIPLPELLGNGKEPLQLGFDGALSVKLVALLLIVRFIITLTSLRVGAKGGLLTPGLMHGALLAILLGSAWNLVFPIVPMSAFAIIGATAFLAASMKMPITAMVLMLEVTRTNHDSLIPMLLAVVGSVTMFNLLQKTNN